MLLVPSTVRSSLEQNSLTEMIHVAVDQNSQVPSAAVEAQDSSLTLRNALLAVHEAHPVCSVTARTAHRA